MKWIFFLLVLVLFLAGCKSYDVDQGVKEIKAAESSYLRSQDSSALLSSYLSLKNDFGGGSSGKALSLLVDFRMNQHKARQGILGVGFVVDDSACQRLDEFDTAKSNLVKARVAFQASSSARSRLINEYSEFLNSFGDLTALDAGLKADVELAESGLGNLELLLNSKCASQ